MKDNFFTLYRMATSSCTPLSPTVPHVSIGAREAGYLGALQAWQIGTHPKCTVSYLCQLPLGRLAVMTTLNGPGGHDWQLSLLDPGTSLAEASLRHSREFTEWAEGLRLPAPQKVSAQRLVELELKEAQRAGLAVAWARWCRDPELAADLERLTVSSSDVPTVAELGALAIAQSAPETTFSDLTQVLRDAFFAGDIKFAGRTPDIRAIDSLAGVLGLVCDTMQEGVADLVSHLARRRALALRAVLQPLLQRVPAETLARKQAAIDELFQAHHTLSSRRAYLGQDAVPYAGALPVRYPLVNLVADLLRQCQGSLVKWTAGEPCL